MGNPVHLLRNTQRQYGLGAAWRLLADEALKRTVGGAVVQVVWLEQARVAGVKPVDGFTFRFLTPDEVRRHAADPERELTEELAASIERGENACFAALDGDTLAAYGWYAFHRMPPEHPGTVGLYMPPDVSYMWKGFTHPAYRGLRLHAAGMGLALVALSERGIRALISLVEWINEPSLRSCDRLGYERIGRLTLVGPRQRRWIAIPRSIRTRTGVTFVPAPRWSATGP